MERASVGGVLGREQIRHALSDGHVVCSPEPAAIDLTGIQVHLDYQYWLCTPGEKALVVGESDPHDFYILRDSRSNSEGFIRIPPFGFILGQTIEHVGSTVPWLMSRISGLSTNARWGCGVELAGDGDPGWTYSWTLEIVNSTPRVMLLRPKMPIAIIRFHRVDSKEGLYHGRYLPKMSDVPSNTMLPRKKA